jgi:hypothetical protein
MNAHINEVITTKNDKVAKGNKGPELIDAPAKELLNMRRLPAMLDPGQTAALIGYAAHDIPVLISAGLLKPLGNPPANAVKHFATVQVMELAGEIAQLSKMRNVVYEHWRIKNANKTRARQSRHPRNGQH